MSKEFLSGMQVLYIINVEGFVLVSVGANLLKPLLTCVFAHYYANHIHLNWAYTYRCPKMIFLNLCGSCSMPEL
jgi:hypothetical protein